MIPGLGELALSLGMAVAAGLVGCFAVMRRMTLASDAISHIALPGIALALILHVQPLLGGMVMLLLGTLLIWVVGTHDADGPRELPGEVADELVMGGLILRHEPQAGAQFGEVAGHLHPAARIVAPRGTLRRRCFVTDGERVILPAFGAYAGGLNVLDAAFAGMFVRPPLTGALGAGRVRAIGWRRLAGD